MPRRKTYSLQFAKWIGSLLTVGLLVAVITNAQRRKLETIPFTHTDNEQAYLGLLAKALGNEPSSRAILIGYRKSNFPRLVYEVYTTYTPYGKNEPGDLNRIKSGSSADAVRKYAGK